MIGQLAAAPALPLGQAGKYVAGAYVVAFVILLVYVAIMAMRAQRVERDLEQLRRDVEAARGGGDRPAPDADPATGQAPAGAASSGDPERSGSLL